MFCGIPCDGKNMGFDNRIITIKCMWCKADIGQRTFILCSAIYFTKWPYDQAAVIVNFNLQRH
jgi:hypothetical protein